MSSKRTVREHFRLLFTLVHALSQSGARVVDGETGETLDPGSTIDPPVSGHPCTYKVVLSSVDSELLTQVYLLQTLLVSDARVHVHYRDHEGDHEEEIVKIGWSDPALLTAKPITAIPADYQSAIRLFPQSCELLVKI